MGTVAFLESYKTEDGYKLGKSVSLLIGLLGKMGFSPKEHGALDFAKQKHWDQLGMVSTVGGNQRQPAIFSKTNPKTLLSVGCAQEP